MLKVKTAPSAKHQAESKALSFVKLGAGRLVLGA